MTFSKFIFKLKRYYQFNLLYILTNPD